MDSLITAAARALAAGDPLGALSRVALRDDAPALALRGTAMAQLGDFDRARTLLRRAARAFGAKSALARARCVVAEAEIALASRDLGRPERALEAARLTLETHGDFANAAHARYLEVRRLVLIGRLEAADARLAILNPALVPPASRAAHDLLTAAIALRRMQATKARAALMRAAGAAAEAGIPALVAEVGAAARMLDRPAARFIRAGSGRTAALDDVETALASGALVVDGLRHLVKDPHGSVPLARRPVLFTLVRALAEAWPADVPRDRLIAVAFGGREADESHRARLRVEIGRLRRLMRSMAGVEATKSGFMLAPRHAGDVVVLARPVEEKHAAVLALLSDGEAWSSSALAAALGAGPRTVQRALEDLRARGRAHPVGRGRARRWTVPPGPGIATVLLLPRPFAAG